MSVVLTMTSLAIIAGLTLSEVSLTTISELVSKKEKHQTNQGYETVFTDSTILHNTLINYDCHVEVVSENEYLVESVNGKLRYYRENNTQPFSVYFDKIDNPDGLIKSINEFERDYGRNVQDFTYHHIKENLADNMRIYDEQIVDDELVLTINVD